MIGSVDPLNSNSVAGRIIELRDRRFSTKQIALELRIPIRRVLDTLARAKSRTLDSRRIAEIHEMLIELLAGQRELLSVQRQKNVAARMRGIEKRDLPHKFGAAIAKVNHSSSSTPSPAGPTASR